MHKKNTNIKNTYLTKKQYLLNNTLQSIPNNTLQSIPNIKN